MRVAVLGGGGMLGAALADVLASEGCRAMCCSRSEVDLVDTAAVGRLLDDFRPDAVINAAAMTNVDGCETDTEQAFEVNGKAVGRAARIAADRSISFVHVSTDYVFDGPAGVPFVESSPTTPRSVYGKSKLLGEQLALEYPTTIVVRTSWLYGPHGNNFVKTMARLGKERASVSVVDDQVGCPTYTPYLAQALVRVASAAHSGQPPLEQPFVLHYCNRGPVSWFGFARAVFSTFDCSAELEPITTKEFPRPAPRPAYSVLSTERYESLFGPVPEWQSGLIAYRENVATDGW